MRDTVESLIRSLCIIWTKIPSIQVDTMTTDYDDQFKTYMQHISKKCCLTAPMPTTSGFCEVETYLNKGMLPI
jgi:hypothetical protein